MNMSTSANTTYKSYVRKDGNIIEEFGKRPNNNGCRNVGELMALEKKDVPPQFAKIWQRLKDEAENDIDIDDWHKDVVVYYIQGPSGIGKTERAKQ